MIDLKFGGAEAWYLIPHLVRSTINRPLSAKNPHCSSVCYRRPLREGLNGAGAVRQTSAQTACGFPFGIVLGVALLSWAGSVLAGDNVGSLEIAAQVNRGRAIAEAHCKVCHAIGLTDESPTWVNSNTPFRRLHERYPIAMLEEAARTGMISGHDEMPGFDFTLDEVKSLLSYIDSLAPEEPHYVKRRGQR